MSEPFVHPDLLDVLCCPCCRGELSVDREAKELSCPSCLHTYPVVDGIPVMFPTDVKSRFEELFGRYWDSEEQAETYDRFVEGAQSMLDMHHHVGEVRATKKVIGSIADCRLLDCGCGNGRFFEEYPASVTAFGVDASLNLLRICKKKGRCERLVCCELEHLPFRDGVFDRIVSVRVLQHIRRQERAVLELARALKERGEIILHLYNDWSSKAFVKKIRQSKTWSPIFNAPFRALFRSLSPFEDWGIDYDEYNTVPQVRGWLRSGEVRVVQVQGSGFGFNKWFVDGFMLAGWVASRRRELFRGYLSRCLKLEEALGSCWPFNRVMEKFVLKGVKDDRATGEPLKLIEPERLSGPGRAISPAASGS